MEILRTGDRRLIRELNTSIVLDCIRRHGPLPRVEVAKVTGIARSTVSGIVSDLIDLGLVETVGSGVSTGGRRPEMIAFNPHRFYVAGIKLQPDSLVGCLTDLEGEIRWRAALALESKDAGQVLGGIERIVAMAGQSVPQEDILGIGLAFPGLIDRTRGVSVRPHFFRWKDLPVRDEVERRTGLSTWIDNDARVASLGEKWAMRESGSSFLFLTVGIGIGGSLVLGGEVVEGEVIGAGHIGHMCVEPGGSPCNCGLRGCLDAVAGDAALLAYYAEESGRPAGAGTTAIDVLQQAREGDAAALRAVDRICRYLAIGVGNVVKLLGLRRIVVGGESAIAGGKLLVDTLLRHVREQVFPDVRDEVQVGLTRLGNDVWLVGAAALVIEAAFAPPIYSTPNPVQQMVSKGVAVPDS